MSKITSIGLLIFPLILLTGCGTSHLNCDTEENQASLKQAVHQIIDDFLQSAVNPPLSAEAKQQNAPSIEFKEFAQNIIDINAKKCDYILDVKFEHSQATVHNVPVSVVFRSTGINGQTHELMEFTLSQGYSTELGIAAVKNSKVILNSN